MVLNEDLKEAPPRKSQDFKYFLGQAKIKDSPRLSQTNLSPKHQFQLSSNYRNISAAELESGNPALWKYSCRYVLSWILFQTLTTLWTFIG